MQYAVEVQLRNGDDWLQEHCGHAHHDDPPLSSPPRSSSPLSPPPSSPQADTVFVVPLEDLIGEIAASEAASRSGQKRPAEGMSSFCVPFGRLLMLA